MNCIELNINPKCETCKSGINGVIMRKIGCAVQSWHRKLKEMQINAAIKDAVIYVNEYKSAEPYFMGAIKAYYPEFIDKVNSLLILK